jgi:hypothetical protein
VFDVVSKGIAASEVTGGIVGEVQHKIDEAFRELEEHQDLEKALDKSRSCRPRSPKRARRGDHVSGAGACHQRRARRARRRARAQSVGCEARGDACG